MCVIAEVYSAHADRNRNDQLKYYIKKGYLSAEEVANDEISWKGLKSLIKRRHGPAGSSIRQLLGMLVVVY